MARPWLTRFLCRTRSARLAAGLLLSAWLLAPAGAPACAAEAPEVDRWLAALDGDKPPAGARAARALLERLERRDAEQRAQFDAAARRNLPAKAAERLTQARAAYEAGQGRLLVLLRELAGPDAADAGVVADRAAAAGEARVILTRLSEASQREPLSAELKVRAPALSSGPLPGRRGAAAGPEAPIGPVPPALQALAESLNGPIEAYAWVRNNLRSEFYYGSLKGPLQTFLDHGGNDADSAALLVALLRAQGIPARFVQGTAQVDIARLMAVTGAATPEQAVRVLERAGIPHEPVVGSSGVTAVRLARIWAEAYVPYANYRGLPADPQGKVWLPLDPGFKDLHAPAGLDVVAELGLDPAALVDEYLTAPRSATPLAFVRQRATDLLAARGLTYEEALNDRSVLPEDLGILPNALPYKTVGASDASYEAPLPHAIRVVGESNGVTLIDATFPLPDAIGRRLTLSYLPFDEGDAQAVAQYGSLRLTPPYLIDVKPVLKAGGVAVAVGQAPVGMAVKYELRLELSFPGGREDVRNQVLAGNLMAIGLAGGEAPGQEQQGGHAAALLAHAASEYLRRWNHSDTELADLLRVVPVRPTASACFVMSDLEVEYAGGDPRYPISFDWKGVAVDADLRASAPAGVEGRAAEPRFALMSGLEGSILENRLFEDLWQVASVSTAKALQLAAQQGTSVLSISSGNVDAVLPGLPFEAAVKAEIRDAALRGFTVRVPQAAVSFLAWTGVGYWILDAATGESAWQLQGGHSGGVTALARIDWPPGPLAETLIDQDEQAAPPESQVTTIVKFVSTDYQDGIVNQPVGRPFRVLALDAEGQRVPQTSITFQVLGGGGVLVDPVTGAEAAAITVLSNARGEAEARLRLGKRTDEIPRFTCLVPDPPGCSLENERYATQVGLNLVTASVGRAMLAEPFVAYGKPDIQSDGTYQYASLSFKVLPSSTGISNLRVAGLLAVNVQDPHGNPISNFPVVFSYRPPPEIGTAPPGWQLARGATETPGKLLGRRDYERCIEHTPSPRWGDCPGEQATLRTRSSSYGSVAYPVIGDSPYSQYYFDIGTDVTPGLGWLAIPTWGWMCTPDCNNWSNRWPKTLVDTGLRPVLSGPTGNLIEAYPPGAKAPLGFSAQAVYEGYTVEPFVDADGNKRYHVTGNNQWTREPLDDSRFTLTPATAGTGVSPAEAVSVGSGNYRSQMAIAGTAQLNTVRFSARHAPWLIPPYLPNAPDEVDPSAVDEITLEIRKRKYPDRPWQSEGSVSLWGVRAAIEAVQPTPVSTENGRVTQSASIIHRVEPPAYLAELAPTNLWFTLDRDSRPVLAGAGADGRPFQIPAGLAVPPGDYTARLAIPAVSWGGGGIESTPYPVTTCETLGLQTPSVILPAHGGPSQGSGCEIQDEVRFTLCRRSAVTLLLGGEVLTASVDGTPRSLEDLELDSGVHVVQVPHDVALSFHQPVVPFVVRALEEGSTQPAREAWGAVSFSDNLIALRTSVVTLKLVVDYDNGTVCGNPEYLEFAVCQDARATIKVDGSVLAASLDGGPVIPLEGLPLRAGRHTVKILPELLGVGGEKEKPFRIDAQATADPNVRDTAAGRIVSSECNRPILPVGHTFVKGVDLFDGHLVQREVDLSLPGRHLGLEMSRTYSSAGRDPESPMGAGWNWNYDLSLRLSSCGLAVLTTRDGTQAFRTTDGGISFEPQKGYHGRLLPIDGVTFDYFDKGNVQHRFVQRGYDASVFRLAWIREPHGDRLVMGYQDLLLVKVSEEHNGQVVHELRLSYAQAGGFDRIRRAEIVQADGTPLGLVAQYDYDPAWGNLVTATRLGRNIGGGPRADDRVHQYSYSVNDPRDHSQLTQTVDPNGNRTRYQYYASTDILPGEGGRPFFVLDKEERLKAVYEYPDQRELATRFSYDLREAGSLHQKTTVTDAALRETLYGQDGAGATIEIQEPLGKTTRMTWTGEMRKQTELDAKQRLTRFTWDGKGNLESETIQTGDADLGDVLTSYLYDPTYNKLLSKTDGEGHTTTWTLDPATGDITESADAEGNRTGYAYTEGLLSSQTDPRGNVTGYSDYNVFGQATVVTDPRFNGTHREYDSRGRMTAEYDDFGRRTEYEYDGLDRVTTLRRVAGSGSDDQVTVRTYYPSGQVRSETNANGARTEYTLDGLNRVIRTTTRLADRVLGTTTTYDLVGNKATETDARDVRRRFVYDDLNRLTQVRIESGLPNVGPTGEVAAYDYDLVGNKLWERDLAGLQTDCEYDGLYRVKTKWLPEQMPAGHSPSGRLKEEYRYDKVGNRKSVKDANGHETVWDYDRLNRVTSTIQDPAGLALTTTLRYCNAPAPDPAGGMGLNKCEQYESPRGLRTLHDYDALNRESRRTVLLEGPDGDPQTDTYVTETQYQDESHQILVTDPNLNVALTRLDGLDRPTEQVIDYGEGRLNLRTLTYYDGLGNPSLVVDPRGNPTRSEYDGLGRLVRRTDAKNASSTYDYDAGGLRTLEVDRRGVRRRFEYDNLGRQVRASLESAPYSGVGWSHDTEYRDRQHLRLETDARGHTTTFKLDGLGRVIEETDADTKTALSTWDGVNKVVQTDRRLAHHATRYEYDAVNRLTLTIDPAPLNHEARTRYLDAQNQVEETDRRLTVKRIQHDALGRVRSVTGAVGQPEEAVLERNTYDGNGNKTVALDGEGKRTDFAYDAANRLRSRTDGTGTAEAAVTRYEYDQSGNQTLEQDQRARDLNQPFSVKRVYDDLNRLTTVYDGLGNRSVYDYDAEGNRTLMIEPGGQQTTFAYDELGKVTAVAQPGSIVTRHRYDGNRNPIEQQDALDRVVSFEYDSLNRLTKMIQPGPVTTEHAYDENGNETLLTDPKGQIVTSTYDELSRLQSKAYGFSPTDPVRPWRHTTAVGFAYDANGNLTGIEESVARAIDPPGTPPSVLTTGRTYDRLDRLSSETTPLPEGGSRTVSYSYYGNGARKTVTDPGGSVSFYEYDGQNRLETATISHGTPAAATTRYGYWPDDLLKEVIYPSGLAASHSYDNADRLTMLLNAKGATVLSSYAYTYDRNGNRTSQVEQNGGTIETTTYTYDDLSRLQTVSYPVDTNYANGRVVSYGYDKVGNRTRETERDSAGTVLADKQGVFDDLNRLTALNDLLSPAGSTAFSWDANGNQTAKTRAGSTTRYHYDVRDKLVEVGQGSSILSRFQYDSEGRRNVKIGEFGTEQYVYDGTSTFLEYDQGGSLKAKYDYGSDRLIGLSRLSGSLFERRYYSFDALRSVTNLSDETGAVKASYHLDPWGNFRFPSELNADGDTVAAKNRFAFTGYLWDKETNLFFAKARFYDPEVGRFTSQDSFLGQVDNPPSLHRYFYAADNPTRYVDPDGHDFKLNKDQKYGPNEVAAPVLSGKVSDGDLKQYLAYVEKHGSREDVIQATLGATGVYSKSYGQGVAKLEVAAIAGTVAGAPVAIGGGSAALVGAVGGGTQGFASGLLDNASAAEIALRTVGGAALGSAIGWVAQRLGAVTWGEASPSAPGATKTSTVVAKPASGEPEPRAPLLSDEALARGMSGGSQGADALASSQKAANTARRTSGKIEVLADAGPEGAHTSKLNAQIAEIRGYQAALENDHIGIQGTGKTDAGGVDYITLDQEGRIVAWDAKYRGPGYRHPSTLPADKLQRWMPEIQEAVEAMPDGPAKVAAQKALEAGQVVGRIFKWPPQ